ncbi:hypothetical protein WMF38_44170 [Sorangium sp. So ce118]
MISCEPSRRRSVRCGRLAAAFLPGMAAAAAVVLTACGASPEGTSEPAPPAGLTPLPGPMPPGGPFDFVSDLPVSADGTTPHVKIPLGRGHGKLVVRTRFIDEPADTPPCFQIDDVIDADGQVWVPPAETHADWGDYCTSCAQRVSVGHGYGLFAFPNDGSPLPAADFVSLRVALRNCVTKLPLDPAFDGAPPPSVRVEALRAPPVRDGTPRTLRLFFAFAEGAQFQRATASDTPLLARALAAARAMLAPAGIELALAGAADVAAPAAPLAYSDADRTALDAVHQDAVAAAASQGVDPSATLVVAFVPCLEGSDDIRGGTSHPEGLAAHLPAGYAIGGHADAVFLQGASCRPAPDEAYWSDDEPLAKVLVHEIGHALGLYHSVEADGRTDHLSDTDEHNLMLYAPLLSSVQGGLSERQIRVLRSHPLLQD